MLTKEEKNYLRRANIKSRRDAVLYLEKIKPVNDAELNLIKELLRKLMKPGFNYNCELSNETEYEM